MANPRETVFIMPVGLSHAAVLNAAWALIEHGIEPSKIILLYSEGSAHVAEALKKALPTLVPVRVELKMVSEDNVSSAISTVKAIAEREIEAGRRVIADITGGRKTMSAAIFAAASQLNLEVYYLHLRDQSYLNELYPLIPIGAHKLVKIR